MYDDQTACRSGPPNREFPSHDREHVPCGRAGEDAGDESAHVACTGDVAPAEEPAAVPAVADGVFDLGLGDPVAGEGFPVGVVVLQVGQAGQGADVELGLGGVLVGGEAVVVVGEHLGLVEREPPLRGPWPGPAVELGAACSGGSRRTRRARSRWPCRTGGRSAGPRGWRRRRRRQDREAPVDAEGDVGVRRVRNIGQGAGVGVQHAGSRPARARTGWSSVCDMAGEERQPRLANGVAAGQA